MKHAAIRPTWQFALSKPAHLIAFGFGVGLIPWMPGTFGTLLGFPLYWAASYFLPKEFVFVLVAAWFLLGVWACAQTNKALGVADHGAMVWDEVVAFMLVLLFIPASVISQLMGFLLFRLFDIAKPFPIRYFDSRLKNGFGVMFDDLLAALYALLCFVIWDFFNR
jgi:phosphatidylglycerophosphatase A